MFAYHITIFMISGGSDYSTLLQNITFTTGQSVGSQVNISIPIINDNTIESIESFFGSIFAYPVKQIVDVRPDKTEVSITDDDSK